MRKSKEKFNRNIVACMLLALLLVLIPSICFSNSAEPPSILVIAPNAPNDIEMGIVNKDKVYTEVRMLDKGIEKYFVYYSRDLKAAASNLLAVKLGGKTYMIEFTRPLYNYDNVFTLELKTMTLTPGKLLSRSIFLVTSRVVLTLIIEGAIFFLMGYREKRSWIGFFVINLITQGALNIWLNTFSPLQSYLIVSLVFGEILVFAAEILGFYHWIDEESHGKTVAYVLIANTVSLVVGGYIIQLLPI